MLPVAFLDGGEDQLKNPHLPRRLQLPLPVQLRLQHPLRLLHADRCFIGSVVRTVDRSTGYDLLV